MTGTYVSNAELEAAFLAAREHGKILNDDVLRAIILAARKSELPDPTHSAGS